jgi:hypothetical protein
MAAVSPKVSAPRAGLRSRAFLARPKHSQASREVADSLPGVGHFFSWLLWFGRVLSANQRKDTLGIARMLIWADT